MAHGTKDLNFLRFDDLRSHGVMAGHAIGAYSLGDEVTVMAAGRELAECGDMTAAAKGGDPCVIDRALEI